MEKNKRENLKNLEDLTPYERQKLWEEKAQKNNFPTEMQGSYAKEEERDWFRIYKGK